MRIHLISIGGAVMHNLALELQRLGHNVTGSDDEVYDPSKSRLERAGLLPKKMGWDASRINPEIDVVILGMHAREDNPELQRARELGLKIQSFPEFVYESSKDKKRVVVGGSHGKTSTTAMIMHVLRHQKMPFDYLVGSKLDGFELMVHLSDAPVIILEGDEYLSSPIDRRPKFLWYKPDIAVVTGVAWDHINVFPTFENYCEQFERFAQTVQPNGTFIYYEHDRVLEPIARNLKHVKVIGYEALKHEVCEGEVAVQDGDRSYLMQVFGKHNLENMNAALLVCESMGIDRHKALTALQSFTGTARRLERIHEDDYVTIYRDFAHSPSKVKATVDAVKSTYPDRNVVAVLELHTFSSLNKAFLPLYKDTMSAADHAFVHFNSHVFEWRKMEELSADDVQSYFGNVEVETDVEQLWSKIKALKQDKTVYLMMSSGSFGGKDVLELAG